MAYPQLGELDELLLPHARSSKTNERVSVIQAFWDGKYSALKLHKQMHQALDAGEMGRAWAALKAFFCTREICQHVLSA